MGLLRRENNLFTGKPVSGTIKEGRGAATGKGNGLNRTSFSSVRPIRTVAKSSDRALFDHIPSNMVSARSEAVDMSTANVRPPPNLPGGCCTRGFSVRTHFLSISHHVR